VANLLGGIVAAASGTSIEKGVQETIDAVRQATVGMSRDEGATADQIAKILRLETTTAWRRLNKAAFKGFVVNLETRPRQPGRYRITNKEVEVEDLLPSLEAIKGEAVQTVQTRNPIRKRQVFEEVNDCTTDCTIAPIASPSEDEVADVIDVAFEGPLLLEVTPKGHAALANDLAEADAAFQRRKAG